VSACLGLCLTTARSRVLSAAMPRRVVELSQLETAGEVAAGATSGGAIRSSKRSAVKRKSPYARPVVAPGPPTTGLSGAMGALAVDVGLGSTWEQGLRSSSRRKQLQTPRGFGDSLGSLGGPLSRQSAKEAEWKAKLARDQTTSWWDMAKMNVGPSGLEDPAVAFAKVASDAGAAPASAPPAALVASDSKAALKTLARGRNHARADMASVNQWRDSAIDSFLSGGPSGASSSRGTRGTPPVPSMLAPVTSSVPEHSPGHMERKYGNRRARLPPLSGRQRSQLAEASDASRQREAANVVERHRVFVASS